MIIAISLAVFFFITSASSIVITYIALKKLLKFDSIWNLLDKDLAEYQKFLIDTTSRGILTDSPEIREFHKRTTRVRDEMVIYRAVISSARGRGGGWVSTSEETSTQT